LGVGVWQRVGGAVLQFNNGTYSAPQRQVIRERTVVETNDPPPGPNATTEPPENQYFVAPNGDEVNAFGEKKGSAEDKRRRAAGGIA
jgi:hypothetical protein